MLLPSLLTGVALALCRLPRLFAAGWRSDVVHAALHAFLLLAAIWTWHTVRPGNRGALFINLGPVVPISAWLGIAHGLWFPWYARAPRLLHVGALGDQHSAGWLLLGATVIADTIDCLPRPRFHAGLRWAGLAALALALIGSGCERASVAALSNTPGIHASLAVTPSPPALGAAQLTVSLSDSQGHPLQAQRVEVVGEMDMPGMAPVQAAAIGTVRGTYVVDGFQFTMGGEWLLTVKGQMPNGAPFDYHLPPLEVGS